MEMVTNSSIGIFGLFLLQYLKLIFNLNEVGGDRGGEVREAGEKRAGSGSSKMAGCGSEMQNATR